MKSELPPHERYQFKPQLGSSHWWALSVINALPKPKSVLDIGSGSGAMGAQLKQLNVPNICAVEPDAGARAHAAPHYSRMEASLDSYKGQKFDLILLLDVLEHVSDPKAFFEEVLNVASSGAHIILSVPNVAHWSVRLPLLFGYFHYTSRGILDRTHLNFFTWRSLNKFIIQFPELQVVKRAASIEPLELVLPQSVGKSPAFSIISQARRRLAHFLPGFFAYQLLRLLKVK